MADEPKIPTASEQTPTDASVPTTADAAAATGAVPGAQTAPKPVVQPAASAAAGHAARPAVPPRPAAPAVPAADVAGKTTSIAAPATRAVTAASAKTAADTDDTSPLLTRRVWIGLAWGAFSAASVAALAATGRFMFPNVINEPPQQFKAGFPPDYGMGVDERWKEKFGVWLVRTPDDVAQHASGFFALLTVCTHLGCTPNYLAAEGKFKCPCHGSGYHLDGINFEGPTPRPLERCRVVLADDGQIQVDKSRKFQYELGQWIDPEAFLKA